MMIYEEKQTLLKETKDRLINEVGKSPLGQSLREELVDLMSDLSDVRNIPEEIVMGEQSRLVAEVIGRREASKQLLKFYKRLIPQEKKTIKKIYK